eukprot:5811017-Amphidinium_carterae.1
MTTCARLAVSCTVYKTPWPPTTIREGGFTEEDELVRFTLHVQRTDLARAAEFLSGCYLHLLTLHSFGPYCFYTGPANPPGFHVLREDRRGGFLIVNGCWRRIGVDFRRYSLHDTVEGLDFDMHCTLCWPSNGLDELSTSTTQEEGAEVTSAKELQCCPKVFCFGAWDFWVCPFGHASAQWFMQLVCAIAIELVCSQLRFKAYRSFTISALQRVASSSLRRCRSYNSRMNSAQKLTPSGILSLLGFWPTLRFRRTYMQLALSHVGYHKLKIFMGLGETRTEVKSSLKSNIGLDADAGLAQRQKVALVLAAWEASCDYVAQQRKDRLEARASNLPKVLQVTEQSSMRVAYEARYVKLENHEVPGKAYLGLKLEQVELNEPRPESSIA